MDMFNVPKKVNRHVLKALNTLCDGKVNKRITTKHIISQVKYQMRDLVPVLELEQVVQKSLKNLSDLGLIESAGAKGFSIGRYYAAQNVSGKRKSGNLPNDDGHHSEDTLSDDDFDRTRKTKRSNEKPLRYSGLKVHLPKARRQSTRTRPYAFDTSSYASDAWYLTERAVQIPDFSMACEYGEYHLQNVGNASTGMMLPSVPLSVHSLEIHEIPCEGENQKPNADSNQAISGEVKTYEARPSGEQISNDGIRVSPQSDMSLPNTTCDCANTKQQEQSKSLEGTIVDHHKFTTLKPSKSHHFLN